MKSDYAEKCLIVLSVMLHACCLEFDGHLCQVSGNMARPLTVPEIAYFSKIKQRTVERILHDLKDMRLIVAEKQFRRYFPEGLKVAAVWRVFTRSFWEKLGLWGLFVESVKYAAAHAKLKLKNPIKLVGKRKSLSITEKQQRQSRQNNLWFIAMTGCEHRHRARCCPGGYQCTEVCDICRKFPD